MKLVELIADSLEKKKKTIERPRLTLILIVRRGVSKLYSDRIKFYRLFFKK